MLRSSTTGGVAAHGGAILVGLTLGRVVERMRRRRGAMLVGLGIGLTLGALFTRWSTVTNFLFLLGGAIVLVQGLSLSRRSAHRAVAERDYASVSGGAGRRRASRRPRPSRR